MGDIGGVKSRNEAGAVCYHVGAHESARGLRGRVNALAHARGGGDKPFTVALISHSRDNARLTDTRQWIQTELPPISGAPLK